MNPVDLVTIHDDSLLERLGTKFTVGDGCWEWHGARHPLGHGQVWCEGRVQYAHRVMYRLFVGEIPREAVLDHLCRNPSCVRPGHLEPVHWRENIARGAKSGPKPKLHCPHGHEMTPENVAVHNGHRHCRSCGREDARRRYWRKRNA